MPNNGAVIITPKTYNQPISKGFHNGQGYVQGDQNLISQNILSGINIFGVQGTARPFKVATGGITWTIASQGQFQRENITVGASNLWVITNTINLNFTPNFFIIRKYSTSESDLANATRDGYFIWHDGSVIPSLNGAYTMVVGDGSDSQSGILVLLENPNVNLGFFSQFIHVNGSAVTWRDVEPSFTEHWYWKAMYV